MASKSKTPMSAVSAGAKRGTDAPTAVLIGVTGGFGHALAKLLADEGYRLVLAARSENDAAALRFIIEPFELRREPGDKLDIDEVIRRTPQLHDRDMAVQRDADLFTRHAVLR